MKIALAADHGGFDMKELLIARLRQAGHEVSDFGARRPIPSDDYPDYVAPLARAVAAGEVDRGIVICGSGVGASVAANKVKGIRPVCATIIDKTPGGRRPLLAGAVELRVLLLDANVAPGRSPLAVRSTPGVNHGWGGDRDRE